MHFSELRIYQLAVQFETAAEELIKKIPYYWEIEQVDQVSRSTASISANIVEGFNRRFYPKDYIRFLNIALSSSDESQHHFTILFAKKCIDKTSYDFYLKAYRDLSIRILNFILYLKKKHQISQFNPPMAPQ